MEPGGQEATALGNDRKLNGNPTTERLADRSDSILEQQSNLLSPIQQFYNGQSIFITGGTGFVGKLLIEKLLRECPGISFVYLLIRPKKGKDMHQRIEEIFDDPVKILDPLTSYPMFFLHFFFTSLFSSSSDFLSLFFFFFFFRSNRFQFYILQRHFCFRHRDANSLSLDATSFSTVTRDHHWSPTTFRSSLLFFFFPFCFLSCPPLLYPLLLTTIRVDIQLLIYFTSFSYLIN